MSKTDTYSRFKETLRSAKAAWLRAMGLDDGFRRRSHDTEDGNDSTLYILSYILCNIHFILHIIYYLLYIIRYILSVIYCLLYRARRSCKKKEEEQEEEECQGSSGGNQNDPHGHKTGKKQKLPKIAR